jgi:NADPH-dependent 2,4-dienoyl-CoA reductase/sulfur reductase-like enzyme
MKGEREKELERRAMEQLEQMPPRKRVVYPAVMDTDVQDAGEGPDGEKGKVITFRMFQPWERVDLLLSEDQAADLANRLQGLTANGARIATPDEQARILGGLMSEN